MNFPTKQHWHNPSEIGFIETGLVDLVNVVGEMSIGSIAIPPLGCGLGGLSWSDVRPMILEAFEDVSVHVHLYVPA